MNSVLSVTGELCNHKVAAVFADAARAAESAQSLRERMPLGEAQVQVLTPGDPNAARKLEPENRGIVRTMWIAHAKLGLAGAVAGALLFVLLWWLAIPAVTASPRIAFALITALATVFGLLAGGLVSLRPDRDPQRSIVQRALRKGRSAVVVHAFTVEERDQAEAFLQADGGETVRDL